MKGVKIGTVTGISFDPRKSQNVVLQFTVKRQYRIPTDSEAKIYSDGLMAEKPSRSSTAPLTSISNRATRCAPCGNAT